MTSAKLGTLYKYKLWISNDSWHRLPLEELSHLAEIESSSACMSTSMKACRYVPQNFQQKVCQKVRFQVGKGSKDCDKFIHATYIRHTWTLTLETIHKTVANIACHDVWEPHHPNQLWSLLAPKKPLSCLRYLSCHPDLRSPLTLDIHWAPILQWSIFRPRAWIV